MEKKYEFVKGDTIKVGDNILHRIRAVKCFNDVSRGDLGGYIQSESNLSHKGSCWVYGNACVYENATLMNDAIACNNAEVHGNVKVSFKARVSDNAEIKDNVKVFGHSSICNHAIVSGNTTIRDDCTIGDKSIVNGDINIHGHVNISGIAEIKGESLIIGNIIINSNAKVVDATLFGDGIIISNDAYITSNDDYFNISSFITSDILQSQISFYLSEGRSIMVYFMNEVFTLYDFCKYIKTLKNYEEDRDKFTKLIAFAKARFGK